MFAFGETDKSDAMQKYIPSFESRLQSAGNFIDAHVEKVETVTGGFDMADADPSSIYNFWEQFPNPNNYTLQGKAIINAVYNWNGYPSRSRPGSTSLFNQIFIESQSWEVSDFVMESNYCWHGCAVPSGFVFRWNKETDSAYVLDLGDDVQRHSGAMLYKIKKLTPVLGKKQDGGRDEGWLANYGIQNGNKLLVYKPYTFATSGSGDKVRIEVKGNNIKVIVNNQTLIDYTDSDPLQKGGIGLWAGCTVAFTNVKLQYEMIHRKSLGEAISDVSWRDNSTRFVVYAEDTIPEYMKTTDNKDYQYTITKLLNSNAYLINLGTSLNQATLEQLVKFISTPTEQKGTFILNNSTTQSMNDACDWIIEKVRNLSKPEDWILVNTEVIWETEYNDQEHDLPLNFGEHDGTKNSDNSDILLGESWGVGLTHLYKNEKIFAEKWRYRHFNNYFDNSTIRESYHNTWIEDPVTIFPNPGLYRVNYKRRDNPLYPDVNLTHSFDSYRYWSENYDRIQ